MIERVKLSKKEIADLFFKYINNGDMAAREKLIVGNVAIVYFTINSNFETLNVEDYFDVGMIGLIKAIDTYNPERNAEFITYAIRCVKNEILMSLRRFNKTKNEVALEETICERNGDILNYIDIIREPKNLVDEIVDNLSYNQIMNDLFSILNDKEKEMVKLFFGFYDKEYSQSEVAKILGCSQSCVSRNVSRICNKLKSYLDYHYPNTKIDFEL